MSYDRSGKALSISSSGMTVAIGSPFHDNNRSRRGYVRIYTYDGGQWNQMGMNIDGENAGDYFEAAVSLSSNGMIVSIENGSRSGHVRIYSFDGNQWIQMGIDIVGESESNVSGSAVLTSSDGKTVAIGAP